jgi:hypothetical protein
MKACKPSTNEAVIGSLRSCTIVRGGRCSRVVGFPLSCPAQLCAECTDTDEMTMLLGSDATASVTPIRRLQAAFVRFQIESRNFSLRLAPFWKTV